MARILLVDHDETARRALRGILARGDHKVATVDTAAQAWSLLRRNPGVDLVLTELKLTEGNGLNLVGRLKSDPLLKFLPVVVYTAAASRDAVQQAIALGVQNFLIKPYHDDDIFAELDKACAHPWRDRHFDDSTPRNEPADSAPADRQRLREELRLKLVQALTPLKKCAETSDHRTVAALTSPLRKQAEAAGTRCVVDALQQVTTLVEAERWGGWSAALECLEFSALLVAGQTEPAHDPAPDFNPGAKISGTPEAAEQAAWLAAAAENRCPILNRAELMRAIQALPGCPVIASAAAAFQMMANGHPSSINPLMDVVARDPGLSAQMLIAANLAHPPKPGDNFIEDARLAIGQLGEVRLEQQARSLLIIPEHTLDLSPGFNWPRYWTYLRGVSRLAQRICRELAYNSLEQVARTAGELHDLGKLLLAQLHPGGFRAILEHARQHHLPLGEVEKLFLGCTTTELAAHFAQRSGLAPRVVNVMRWIDDPAAAKEDIPLVAILSLARDLCHHNRVGASGDPVRADAFPLEETAEWLILRENIYPSFDLHKFEHAMHAYCAQLRNEFSGQQAGSVAEIAASASVCHVGEKPTS